MRSELPKGLHEVCGVPMVKLVADAMRAGGIDKIVVVVGHGGEQIVSALGEGFEFAWQHEQKGTGHAVLCAKNAFEGFEGDIVIAPGDTPLVQATFFADLVAAHVGSGNLCTVATAIQPDPTGYGRMVRGENGGIERIVEHKDASPSEIEIREVNAGIYCLASEGLWDRLSGLSSNNSQGEYYFTDIIKILNSEGNRVGGFIASDPDVLVGINDRWQLAQAGKKLNLRLLEKLARDGVTIVDIDSTYVGPFVKVGRDTILEPNTYLIGNTSVGERSHIGPNTRLVDTQVGDESLVIFSNAERCIIGNDVKVGPFANIRPKSVLNVGVNIGNFVEINRSELGEEVKARHLTYIGDSTVGAYTNIGAGTITCNYDGFDKHKTTIGSNAFIGSNSTLVAPLTIGDGAMITAGSVITKNVSDGSAAFGRAQQITKEGWAISFRERKLNKRGEPS